MGGFNAQELSNTVAGHPALGLIPAATGGWHKLLLRLRVQPSSLCMLLPASLLTTGRR